MNVYTSLIFLLSFLGQAELCYKEVPKSRMSNLKFITTRVAFDFASIVYITI